MGYRSHSRTLAASPSASLATAMAHRLSTARTLARAHSSSLMASLSSFGLQSRARQ
jgi:hypothetical protein